MKICKKCKQSKKSTKFSNNKNSKDGLHNWCKECNNIAFRNYSKTKNGLVSFIYGDQLNHSKTRGHSLPSYTNKQLLEWLLNNKKFHILYDDWVDSNHFQGKKPSIDRLDDSIGYSFDNIQLMTWAENKQKGHDDVRSGKLTHGVNPQKAVLQYTKDGIFVKEFVSSCEAQRQTKISQQNISSCCRGKNYKSAGGFVWKFKSTI